MRVFAGSSSVELANGINKKLSEVRNQQGEVVATCCPPNFLGNIFLHAFPSGERYCQYKENIRGCDVYLVQSVCFPANDNLMELLLMVDAARRASAGRITAVIPYFGYSRQDRKDKSRVPISAKLVCNMLEAAGVDRIISVDLHSPQIQGFTDLPFDHLYTTPLLAEAIKNKGLTDVVVVAPDAGAIKRAEAFSRSLKSGFAFIAKKRLSDTEVEAEGFVGNVKGKVALIVDDLSESAGTITEASAQCYQRGAREVYAAVSHPLFTDTGAERLNNSRALSGLFVTNSVQVRYDIPKMVVMDIAPLLAEAISRVHKNESVTDLFEIKGI